MSCFLPACTRNRERHARGDCLLITRGYARWSLLVHCDRCTPRRAPSSPRVLQEVRWLGAQPACPPPGAPTPSSQAVGIYRISLCPLRLLKNGRGRPAWAHPSMERVVLRQGHIGWGYRSAHASGARVCVVGICYRQPVHQVALMFCAIIKSSALQIPAPLFGEGIPSPNSQFWCGESLPLPNFLKLPLVRGGQPKLVRGARLSLFSYSLINTLKLK